MAAAAALAGANNMAGGGNPQNSVYQNASTGLNAAQAGTGAGMMYRPQQLGQTNLQPYMNPYTDSVVNNTVGQIDRMRQMGLNDVGAQATSAGAYGGARHGVAEAATNRAAMGQVGAAVGNLYNQGYNNAQGAAQFDINNQMQGQNMRLGAASQMGNLANLGFGFGQQINQNLSQQGTQQQATQQALIDAARSQFAGYTNSPAQSLQYPLAAIGAAPQGGQTSTTQQKPGLFNYLSMGLGLL